MGSHAGPGPGPNAMAAMGPPYPPMTASLGGIPDIHEDIPISAVFLLLFVMGAVAHVTIFKLNKAQAHKFFLSMVLFGFCMCRIVTCSLRIAWATHPHNVRLGIAAQIFVQVGTVLLFIINLVFTQRIIRAQHPNLGWHRAFDAGFRALIAGTVLTLIMMIVVAILGFYTLNSNTHRIIRDVQLYGSTFFTFIAFVPIPLIFVGLILPRRVRVEKFGIGRFRHKILFLLTAAFVLSLGAGFRAGTLWVRPVPRTESPWYFSKPCFYLFNFTTEVIVVALYAIIRVDRRFHVPNGAKGPGDYNRNAKKEKDGRALLPAHPGDFEKSEYRGYGGYDGGFPNDPYASTLRIYSEEELFDDTATLAETLKYNSTSLELDNASGRWVLRRQSQASLYSDPFRDDLTSRGTLKTEDSNIYSTLEAPPASGRAITAFNPDDVKWETISVAHTHAPSYKSHGDGSHSSLLHAGEKPHGYSYDAGLEKPKKARGDSWTSFANEKSRPLSYQSLVSNATTVAPKAPRSEKRPATEKSGYGQDIKSYAYDTPETGDLGEKRHYRDSLEVPSTPQHQRKSSWRKSVESELRLSIDEEKELEELREAYEKLSGEKREQQERKDRS